eukprot:TRINITY_DN24003_c0_g2_i1.p1 TRINITY_DN24003_c0_g2~~TRINITY_DN24003_c0_g2_i1.p1  ORF type:complete len:380 (+),score=81.67 TRINITY_DN24003_c0_g2_i1:71-1141(+)
MDVLASSAVVSSATQPQPLIGASGLVAGVLITVAVGIWLSEQGRKVDFDGGQQRAIAGHAAAVLMRFAPELTGLTVLAAFASFLLARGDHSGFAVIPDDQAELWGSIKNAWPLLTTADSLFVLQAMVRIVVLLSVAFRGGASAPLAGCSAAFALLAQVCRLLLFAFSTPDVYHIDGPLGGLTSVVFEVAAVPVLLYLSRSLSTRGAAVVMFGGACAAGVASVNTFALADFMPALDALFSLVQLLDFLAACAFLRNTMVALGSVSDASSSTALSVAHVLLPLQALLPAYFFLTAFAPPLVVESVLVRQGLPFEMMWGVGSAQVGLYALAGVLQLAWALDATPEFDRSGGVPLLQVEV